MDNSDAVRALRKQLGWTQKRLAGELRKSEHTVKRWEMGIREPSPELLEKLAALAGGRLSRFFAERAGLPRTRGLVYLHVREGVAGALSAPVNTELAERSSVARLALTRPSSGTRPSARLGPAGRRSRYEENIEALQHQLLARILRSGDRKAIDAVTKALEAFAEVADAATGTSPRAKKAQRKP